MWLHVTCNGHVHVVVVALQQYDVVVCDALRNTQLLARYMTVQSVHFVLAAAASLAGCESVAAYQGGARAGPCPGWAN